MSSDRLILEDDYSQGRAFVRVRITIVNPTNGRQTCIEKAFKIDTGFDGGFHVSQLHRAEISLIGVDPTPGPIGLAGGRSEVGYYCLAYLQQLGDYEFPMPGIEAELILHGSSHHGLLGLDVLKHWITKFDGPNQNLTIKTTH